MNAMPRLRHLLLATVLGLLAVTATVQAQTPAPAPATPPPATASQQVGSKSLLDVTRPGAR